MTLLQKSGASGTSSSPLEKGGLLKPYGRHILCRVIVGKSTFLWTPSAKYVGRKKDGTTISAVRKQGGMNVPIVQILARGGWLHQDDYPVGAFALVDPLSVNLLRPRDVNGKENLCIVQDRAFIAIMDEEALMED